MDDYTKKMMYLLNSRRNMGLDITDGKKHGCGLYDIIEVDDKLYRIMIGSGRTDIILEHPLPDLFWALPIYHEEEEIDTISEIPVIPKSEEKKTDRKFIIVTDYYDKKVQDLLKEGYTIYQMAATSRSDNPMGTTKESICYIYLEKEI